MGGRFRGADPRWVAVAAVFACGVVLSLLPRGEVTLALAAADPGVAPSRVAEATVAEVGADPRVAASEVPERIDVDALAAALPIASGGVDRLVAALHDDDIRGNGRDAFFLVCDLPPGDVPALAAVLHSRDAQQRGYARAILRVRCTRGAALPSPALLAATIEDLRPLDDRWLIDTHVWPVRKHSLLFLCEHGNAALPGLRQALDSQDVQQRTFAAFVLATLGDDASAARVVRVLVAHLADNEIGGDALFASHALFRLGRSGLASIHEWRPYVDEQARSLLDLVVLDLQAPPRTRFDLEDRRGRHRVTGIYHDPVVEYDLHRSPLPRF
jgi:hypothetical protein